MDTKELLGQAEILKERLIEQEEFGEAAEVRDLMVCIKCYGYGLKKLKALIQKHHKIHKMNYIPLVPPPA